ncbi:MAG: hypothetical protein IT460_05210 [Planctomycetes bacterium]|nr:hypothetical protein [Planctomycetota bacterium]
MQASERVLAAAHADPLGLPRESFRAYALDLGPVRRWARRAAVETGREPVLPVALARERRTCSLRALLLFGPWPGLHDVCLVLFRSARFQVRVRRRDDHGDGVAVVFGRWARRGSDVVLSGVLASLDGRRSRREAVARRTSRGLELASVGLPFRLRLRPSRSFSS